MRGGELMIPQDDDMNPAEKSWTRGESSPTSGKLCRTLIEILQVGGEIPIEILTRRTRPTAVLQVSVVPARSVRGPVRGGVAPLAIGNWPGKCAPANCGRQSAPPLASGFPGPPFRRAAVRGKPGPGLVRLVERESGLAEGRKMWYACGGGGTRYGR